MSGSAALPASVPDASFCGIFLYGNRVFNRYIVRYFLTICPSKYEAPSTVLDNEGLAVCRPSVFRYNSVLYFFLWFYISCFYGLFICLKNQCTMCFLLLVIPIRILQCLLSRKMDSQIVIERFGLSIGCFTWNAHKVRTWKQRSFVGAACRYIP